MFKLVENRTAWWPVTWAAVAEDGSVFENRIELKFNVLGRTQYRDLVARLSDQAETGGAAADQADMEMAQAILAGAWRGVGDADGQPLAFSWDLFKILFDQPNFAASLNDAYLRLLAALPEIREKNSAPPPAAGPAAGGAKAATKRRLAKN